MKKLQLRDYINTKRLKRKFSTVGPGFWSSGVNSIVNQGKLNAGINLTLKNSSLYTGKDGCIVIGDNVGLNFGASICSVCKITIGNDVIIGDQTLIYDTDWHGIDGKPAKANPVIIGNHVWIGARVIILEGVTIGDNVIVGAGSVVTRNISSNTKAAGNPARVIGHTSTGYN